MRNAIAVLGLFIAVGGIVFDFWGMSGQMVISPDHPVARSLPDMLIWFFTFLSHLVMLVVGFIYVSEFTRWPWLAGFRLPWVYASTLALLLVVAVCWHVTLAPLFPSQGPGLWGNWLLHSIGPALFIAWWVFAVPHGILSYRQIPLLALPGALYLAWVLIRGAVVHDYPYSIFDPAQGSYLTVAGGVLVSALGVGMADALLVFADGLLARRRNLTAGHAA
jgi:hypothetical protein